MFVAFIYFSCTIAANELNATLSVNAKILKPIQSNSLSISTLQNSFLLNFDRVNNKFNEISFALTLKSSKEKVNLIVDHNQAFCDDSEVATSIRFELVDSNMLGETYNFNYKVTFSLVDNILPATVAVNCNGLFIITGYNDAI